MPFLLFGCQAGKIQLKNSNSTSSLSSNSPNSATCTSSRLLNSPYANSGEQGVDGSASKPYLICTPKQLAQIAARSLDWSKSFLQGNDLDLSQMTLQTIGSNTHPFSGNYDGGGFTISNPTLSASSTDYIGLFGFLDGSPGTAVIKNLSIRNAGFTGNNYVGIVAGFAQSAKISNVQVSGNIVAYAYGGGILGANAAGGSGTEISNVTSSVQVKGVSNMNCYYGGILGFSPGIHISQCSVSGQLGGDTPNFGFIGGVLGDATTDANASVSIENCQVTAPVVGVARVGGIIGNINGGNVSISRSSVNASMTASNIWAGGLIGAVYNSTNVTLAQSSAIGDISADNYAGGLIGHVLIGTVNGSDLFFQGKIQLGTNGVYAGGMTSELGDTDPTKVSASFTRTLLAASSFLKNGAAITAVTNIGAVIGYMNANSATLSQVLYDTSVLSPANLSPIGSRCATCATVSATGATTTQLQNPNYTGYAANPAWDFTNIWMPPKTGSYPVLR